MAEQAFTAMAGPQAAGNAPEVGVGMLGYAFMGKSHSNAYKKIPYMMYPPVAIPTLLGIAGRNEAAVKEAALRFGYERYYTDWRKMLEDDRIKLFDNGGPNDTHAEPCIAAAKQGVHVFSEKPMARNAEEAMAMWDAVKKAGVKNMVAFNYRFVPAVRLAYDLINSGKLGRIYHFRAVYLQEWIMPHYGTPMIWRTDKKQAGSGAIGDLGSHVIDLGRFLVGDIKSVAAVYTNFIPDRQGPDGKMHAVDVDDAFATVVEFDNGAIGTIESSRFCAGRKNYNVIEINGEKGSIRWNLERLNELEVFWVDDTPKDTQGFHTIGVTEGYHPFISNWWPHGHIIGWEHSFVHEINHLLDCIVNDKSVAPLGATFEDGYRNNCICDAIVKSSDTRRHVDVKY